jgi:hypothetical protein
VPGPAVGRGVADGSGARAVAAETAGVTEEDSQTLKTLHIQGRQIRLETGAIVWGGLHEDSVVWKFTSKDKAVTTLSLSRPAMRAVLQLFQGLIGCDRDFAAVSVDPPDSEETGA